MKKTRVKKPQISLIIPAKDEARSLPILYQEIVSVFKKINRPYEVIFVDDGSTDNSDEVLTKLKGKDKKIKVIKFRANFGKSAALAAGFKRAQGKIIITLDADLQDKPNQIPKLLKALEKGFDLVGGWRKRRHDSISKKISSLLFNRGTALISGINFHDFNCGLKVMKKAVVDDLHLHGELHRFIPVLAAKRKFKVMEIPVIHRSRRFGYSKYGIERGWQGIVDLLTTLFLTGYAQKPGHFFGKIGLLLFSVGFVFDAYVAYIRISRGTTGGRIPLLLAGILFMVLGFQLLSIGLIAEMITYFNRRRGERRLNSDS